MEAGSIVEQSDELRARLHRMWASVAGAWEAQADYLDERGAPVTEKMLELTQPQPDERVLELGCGPASRTPSSRRGRRHTTLPPSRNGGSGAPRSPGRSRRGSPRCPRVLRSRFAHARA